jgi:ceramide glucosyltransferase
MTVPLTLAAAYLGQLALKALLAVLYRRRTHGLAASSRPDRATILQALLSGDPALSDTLEASVRNLEDSDFLWLVDEDDKVAIAVCQELQGRHPQRSLRMLRCPPPPQGVNPKAFKLAAALPEVRTPVLVVLDDDTVLGRDGLGALRAGLEGGAGLATGLPRYHSAGRLPGAWLAEFVNSNAVMVYLPSLVYTQPLSLQGMCYALRTEEARRLDAFARIQKSLTDDLALARLLQRNGLRIHQTVTPHDSATTVETSGRLVSILHRWFVFMRLLLAEQGPWTRLGVVLAYGIPPLLLWASLVSGMVSGLSHPPHLLLPALVLILRAGLIAAVKRHFLGRLDTQSPLASLVLELALPFFLLAAYARNTIRWRTRRIRVHSVDHFEYLP